MYTHINVTIWISGRKTVLEHVKQQHLMYKYNNKSLYSRQEQYIYMCVCA